jgi:hypothetical protein
MIRSSFPPQAATRSFYFVVVLSVIAFAHGTDYDCQGSPRQTGRYKMQNVASE